MDAKKQWEPMELKEAGHVAAIVQGGGGKLSAVGGDPGEMRKPKGIEGK